jgi:hypothetical protein
VAAADACTAAAAVVSSQARRSPGVFEATAGRVISSTFRASGRTEKRRIAMSRFLAPLALSAGLCVFFAGAMPAAEQETSVRPVPSAGQAKILAALDQPTEFDFKERPFGEVIDYFHQKHEIKILLDRKSLRDAGIDTDAPITQTLKNIRLRSALRLMLAQLDLTYVVGDGYLLITSENEAENKLSVKVYPVRDLVALDSDFRPAPPANDGTDDSPSPADMLPRPPFSGLGGFGLGSRRDKLDEAGDFSGLIDMITSSIAPTTWDEVGGPGAIAENQNAMSIAVSQTDDVHEEIVVLLAALRRVRDDQLAAAKSIEPPMPPEAPPEQMKIRPLRVRAFRLMRGTLGPGKSGWRPPTPVVGDSASRGAQASVGKRKAAEPPAEGDPAKEAESGDKAAEAPPAKEPEPAAGAAEKKVLVLSKDEKLETIVQEIVKLVPQIIEPQSWEPQGEGMIRAVGEGIVMRNTDEVQHRVARLMAELLPDCVPMDFGGPWGPWRAALGADHATVRLRPATTDNWPCQAEPRPSDQEARIDEALREKCDVEFDQLPLIDALTRFAEPRQLPLYIDRKALADAGTGTDTPVTASVKGLTCKTALELLLDELDLTYLVRHEVLIITTKTEAENMLAIKVYPVFDLVARPPNAPATLPSLDFQSLIDNITTNIAPTTWDEVGGPGAIEPFTHSGALVISQTTEIHEEIAEYLRALREVGAAQNANR